MILCLLIVFLMIRRPPGPTLTDTLFPDATLCLSGRQRLRDAAAATAARIRRRRRRLFGDQAYRRPGALPRRRDPRHQAVHGGPAEELLPPHRPMPQPVRSEEHTSEPQ